MLVYFSFDESFMLIEFVFDVFEFFLFLKLKDCNTILKLSKVTIGLVELMAKFPVGQGWVHEAVVDDAFFFHFCNL